MLTRDHILQGVCVCVRCTYEQRVSVNQTTQIPTSHSGNASSQWWRATAGMRARGLPRSTAGSPLRSAPFHLPVSSGFPTTNHWRRKRGKKHRRREKGKFWPWGGGASAELVHSQLQVNPVCLSKLGWCVREQSVNITLFPPALSRGYGWETEAFFYMHVKAQFSLSSLWSVSLQATAPAWTRMLKLLNISAEE